MSSEEGQVIGCHSVDEWRSHYGKGLETHRLVVVDFMASWCGPCRFITPIVAEIAKKTPHVIFLKVDVDELKTIAEEYEIEAMPTFLFIKDGNVIDKVVGANKEELQKKVSQHGAYASSA